MGEKGVGCRFGPWACRCVFRLRSRFNISFGVGSHRGASFACRALPAKYM